MPGEPGALHRATARCHRYASNINRLQYDRRIDPATVFFDVTADQKSYKNIERELNGTGYLRISLNHKGRVQGVFTATIVQAESGKIFQSENLRRQT